MARRQSLESRLPTNYYIDCVHSVHRLVICLNLERQKYCIGYSPSAATPRKFALRAKGFNCIAQLFDFLVSERVFGSSPGNGADERHRYVTLFNP